MDNRRRATVWGRHSKNIRMFVPRMRSDNYCSASALAKELEENPQATEDDLRIAKALRENAETFDRWQACFRQPKPVFAVLDGELPHRSQAWLIRDLKREPSRLIIFSAAALDAELLHRAWGLFLADEFWHPELPSRRVLRLDLDGRVRNEMDGSVEMDVEAEGACAPWPIRKFVRLFQLRTQGGCLEVPGIGSVRVLELPETLPAGWNGIGPKGGLKWLKNALGWLSR